MQTNFYILSFDEWKSCKVHGFRFRNLDILWAGLYITRHRNLYYYIVAIIIIIIIAKHQYYCTLIVAFRESNAFICTKECAVGAPPLLYCSHFLCSQCVTFHCSNLEKKKKAVDRLKDQLHKLEVAATDKVYMNTSIVWGGK